jgi:hypothetical protein
MKTKDEIRSRAEYADLMARLEKSAPEKTFLPNFHFRDEEQMADFLAAAGKRGIRSIDFSPVGKAAAPLGPRGVKWLADHLDLTPDLKDVSLRDCFAGVAGVSALFEKLPGTRVTGVSVAGNLLPDEVPETFFNGLAASAVTSLDLSGTGLKDGLAGRLAEVLPKTSLRHLALNGINLAPPAFDALSRAIVESNVTDLEISGSFHSKTMSMLFERLPESKLRSLKIEKNCLMEDEAGVLLKKVPETDISFLSFGFAGFSSSSFEQEVKNFPPPGCSLEEIKIIPSKFCTQKEIFLCADAGKRLYGQTKFRRFIREQTEKQKDVLSVDSSCPLSEALHAGLLPQLLKQRAAEKKPLTLEECTADTNGSSFLKSAARAGLLPLVFKPENWGTPKDFQAAWDAVPAREHWQMDGQRERPSFRKVKNSFMGLTLQTLLQKQKDSTK